MTDICVVTDPAGCPLLSAAQAAALLGVQAKTVHAWKARGQITPVGLDERGIELYSAADLARAEASPRSRAKRHMALRTVT